MAKFNVDKFICVFGLVMNSKNDKGELTIERSTLEQNIGLPYSEIKQYLQLMAMPCWNMLEVGTSVELTNIEKTAKSIEEVISDRQKLKAAIDRINLSSAYFS